MAIVLASKSPRRQQLMSLVVPHFEVDAAQGEERAPKGYSASDAAQYIAVQKAQDVFARRRTDIVIGCDTVVQLTDSILGKPGDEQMAKEMLTALSGKTHTVHTGVCVLLPGGGRSEFSACTTVRFADISPESIAEYVATKEPYDKAGGYGIQGWAAKYVSGIEGCYYNVMGLPVAALYSELVKIGAVK